MRSARRGTEERVLEAIQLVTTAYRALSEDPPASARAERCVRRALEVLSAVRPPDTAVAMRVAEVLRETSFGADLPLARSRLLGANQLLLDLSSELVQAGHQAAREQ